VLTIARSTVIGCIQAHAIELAENCIFHGLVRVAHRQQGRVQLDADWNEQVSILLHYLQALGRDLIGEHGGPVKNLGFEIKPGDKADFMIGAGRYYVNGILCENTDETLAYTTQKGFPFVDSPEELAKGTYLVYLDVWEQHITYLEDQRDIKEGNIREVALGLYGPDTATRSQLVWQVKVLSATEKTWEGELKALSERQRPRLSARAKIT
jgi:hypothetical protein